MPVRSWPKISQFSSQKHRQAKNHMYRKNYVFETLTLVKCTARFATFHASQFFLFAQRQRVSPCNDRRLQFWRGYCNRFGGGGGGNWHAITISVTQVKLRVFNKAKSKRGNLCLLFSSSNLLETGWKRRLAFQKGKKLFFSPFPGAIFPRGIVDPPKMGKRKTFFLQRKKKKSISMYCSAS